MVFKHIRDNLSDRHEYCWALHAQQSLAQQMSSRRRAMGYDDEDEDGF